MFPAALLLALAAPAATPPGPKAAEPLTPPGDWFRDYPAAALRADEQGRVGFQVEIDAKGAVTGCTIVSTSGSAVLDAATCDAVRANARFAPARDAAGKPVASRWKQATRWALPELPPMPIASFASVARLDIAADGTLNGCTAEAKGAVPTAVLGDACAVFSTGPVSRYLLLKGELRAAHALVVNETALTFDGDIAYPEQHRLGARRVAGLSRVRFDVTPDGAVTNCRVLETAGSVPLPALCPAPLGRFEVATGRDTGRTRSATMLVSFSYEALR